MLLAPLRDHLDVVGDLSNGGSHATFGHSMRATKIQFNAIGAGIFNFFEYVGPIAFFTRHHQRHNNGTVRPVFFDTAYFVKVCL